jgi:hypothetical protein
MVFLVRNLCCGQPLWLLSPAPKGSLRHWRYSCNIKRACVGKELSWVQFLFIMNPVWTAVWVDPGVCSEVATWMCWDVTCGQCMYVLCMYVRTYVRVCVCMCKCMCVCTYVCMYVCMCVCMYVHTYVCVCTYVCMCMYVRMYVCIYVCMCVCMYVRTYVYMCMYVCVYIRMYVMCMYVCTYVRMCVCMYIRVYVCMYVRTYVCVYVCLYVTVVLPCNVTCVALCLSYTRFETAALSYNGFVKVRRIVPSHKWMIYRHFHMQLEPVQAAEELKILKMFVVFDLPKVRWDTNYYAELPQAFCVFARYMDRIWVWRHRSLTRDSCGFPQRLLYCKLCCRHIHSFIHSHSE